MEFMEFKKRFQDHFEEMAKDEKRLFEFDVDKNYLWELYLNSFPVGKNEIFKVKREYDCTF